MLHRPKKSLGQNFLKDQSALRAMVASSEISKGETVLEIGPGKGALTSSLLEAGATVIAVEKDSDLIGGLNEKFASEIKNGQFILICDDILKIDFENYNLKLESYKLIANIPYYITGEILKKFLETKSPPKKIVLLVQKEVAERIVAKTGKESVLSISVKIFGTPKYIQTVKAKYFSPAPKVDSAIIAITPFEKGKISNTPKFFRFLKEAFKSKRKTIFNNLKSTDLPKEKIMEILEKTEIDQKTRPEDISLPKWVELFKTIDLL